jgi:hypothetical protein
MQKAEEADLGTEASRMGRNFQQGCGTGSEQEPEERPLVLPDQRHPRVRHAEDQVKVANRQQFPSPGAQPLLPGIGLALGTVPVAAGVVRDGLMPAAKAWIAVPTPCGRAATLAGAKHFELGPGERIAITFEELVSCPADDSGHLPGWSRHG